MNVIIDGLKIEYTEKGEGIPVLLLHGWGSSYDVYGGVISALCDRCRLVAVNFPGCGGSDTMKAPWTLDNYCDFVLKFMKAVNLDNPIMIGHSHGGRVILKMAASGLVSPPKIVLLDSAGLIPKKSLKQKCRAKSFKVIKRILTLPGLKEHTENLLDKARRHYGSADYNAAPEVMRKTMVSLVNTDLRDIIGNISCPTLLIWGENDTATPLWMGQQIEKEIPDAGLVVMPGATHFAYLERYPNFLAVVKQFLQV